MLPEYRMRPGLAKLAALGMKVLERLRPRATERASPWATLSIRTDIVVINFCQSPKTGPRRLLAGAGLRLHPPSIQTPECIYSSPSGLGFIEGLAPLTYFSL